MRFNIISNITNGAGLQRDFNILRAHLEQAGHQTMGVMFDGSTGTPPAADISIFVEVIAEGMLNAARENWFLPNSEWYFGEVWDRFIPRFTKVLCKTRDCLRLWQAKIGPSRCVYIGFESGDLYDASLPRRRAFLHLAGKSETKNTAAVMAAWREFKLPYPLTVAAWKTSIANLCKGIPNVTHIDRFSDAEVARALNEHRFFLMPSKYEGYGHGLHEAAGCKAVLLTTNAAPMNEFAGIDSRFLMPAGVNGMMRMAPVNLVSPATIATTVQRAAVLTDVECDEIGERARAAFTADREFFRKSFGELVAC